MFPLYHVQLSVILMHAVNYTDLQACYMQKFKDLHQEKTQEGKSNQIDLIISLTI